MDKPLLGSGNRSGFEQLCSIFDALPCPRTRSMSLANVPYNTGQRLLEYAEKTELIKVPWTNHAGHVELTDKGRVFMSHIRVIRQLLQSEE